MVIAMWRIVSWKGWYDADLVVYDRVVYIPYRSVLRAYLPKTRRYDIEFNDGEIVFRMNEDGKYVMPKNWRINGRVGERIVEVLGRGLFKAVGDMKEIIFRRDLDVVEEVGGRR